MCIIQAVGANSETRLFINPQENFFLLLEINPPTSYEVNVPLWVHDDAQNISDLLCALLLTHAVLPQDHAVHISRPATHP